MSPAGTAIATRPMVVLLDIRSRSSTGLEFPNDRDDRPEK
jgi:hypothetical protein